jgi:hypothetical protein
MLSAVNGAAAACRDRGCTRVLFDCRLMSGKVTVTDRFEIGKHAASTIPRPVRIAVLGPVEEISRYRFFETVARNRGLMVTVFSDLDEAIQWLED